MINLKVIGVCGEIGAGKDSFADYIVKKKGYEKIVMSEIIAEELKKLGRPVNREEMQKLTQEYKPKYGKSVWARASIEYAKQKRIRRAVITGVRDSKEVEVFREMLGNDFLLVYITAEPELRYKRIIQRSGPKDPKTAEEVKAQETKDAEIFDIYRDFNKYADVRITNNGMLVELWTNADLILKEKGFESRSY